MWRVAEPGMGGGQQHLDIRRQISGQAARQLQHLQALGTQAGIEIGVQLAGDAYAAHAWPPRAGKANAARPTAARIASFCGV